MISENVDYRVKHGQVVGEWTDWETASSEYQALKQKGVKVVMEQKTVYHETISEEEMEYRIQYDKNLEQEC